MPTTPRHPAKGRLGRAGSGNKHMIRIVLCLAAIMTAKPALAGQLVFSGWVEAAESAVISTRLDGVVADVLFEGGERVEAGQKLIQLDPADAKLALAAAEARLAEATALLEGAERRAARQEQLAERGIAADAQVTPARTARAAAVANLALAETQRDRAALDLERTVIRAPITGTISRPSFTVGAFLEAEAGPPLAEIVSLDPVLVAYETPYADRLASLEATGAETVDALLASITLTLRLPDGTTYGETATPHAASAEVDRETGAVTVWAQFPNPDALLRPGMAVEVLSDLGLGVTPP